MQNTLKKHGLKRPIRSELFLILLIILVSFAGFGLGRLSLSGGESKGISIYFGNLDTDQPKVVASISGARYHYPWCAGASQIKDTNKIIFNTPEDAKNAGYLKAKNCKGLQ